MSFAAFVLKRTFSPREIWREASLGVLNSKCPVASVFVDDEVPYIVIVTPSIGFPSLSITIPEANTHLSEFLSVSTRIVVLPSPLSIRDTPRTSFAGIFFYSSSEASLPSIKNTIFLVGTVLSPFIFIATSQALL